MAAAAPPEVIATPARLGIAECVLREIKMAPDFFVGDPYEVITGSHTNFRVDAFLERMNAKSQYKGCAIFIVSFKLDADAIL